MLQVTYARNQWGSSASTLAFGDIHPSKPAVLSTEQVRGDSYDLNEVLRATLRQNASSVIALKLDVEGARRRATPLAPHLHLSVATPCAHGR